MKGSKILNIVLALILLLVGVNQYFMSEKLIETQEELKETKEEVKKLKKQSNEIFRMAMEGSPGQAVKLPSDPSYNQSKETMSVTIDIKNNFYINETQVAKRELEEKMQEIAVEEENVQVTVRVDRNTRTEELVYLLHICKENKWKAVIATKEN
jgi:biopolymer transport protein ExbD